MDGESGLFDRVVGTGFSLVCRTAHPGDVLKAPHVEFLEAIGAHVATLAPGNESSIRDTDGRLTEYLESHGLEAVITRPDFYAFGAARTSGEIAVLIDDLRERIAYRKEAP